MLPTTTRPPCYRHHHNPATQTWTEHSLHPHSHSTTTLPHWPTSTCGCHLRRPRLHPCRHKQTAPAPTHTHPHTHARSKPTSPSSRPRLSISLLTCPTPAPPPHVSSCRLRLQLDTCLTPSGQLTRLHHAAFSIKGAGNPGECTVRSP